MKYNGMLTVGGIVAGLLVTMPALADHFADQVCIDQYEDASLTNNSGTLVIGDSGAYQVAIDNNEIQARNNNSAGVLYLQNAGGSLNLTAAGGDLVIGSENILLPTANTYLHAGSTVVGYVSSSYTYQYVPAYFQGT